MPGRAKWIYCGGRANVTRSFRRSSLRAPPISGITPPNPFAFAFGCVSDDDVSKQLPFAGSRARAHANFAVTTITYAPTVSCCARFNAAMASRKLNTHTHTVGTFIGDVLRPLRAQ